MTVNRFIHSSTPRLLTGIAAIALFGAHANAQEDFKAFKTKLNNGIEQQPEGEVLKLLEMGLEQNAPAQASAVAESWLKHNLPKNAKLLYLLGRNAELSGNWREASAAYQQFIAKGDVKSAEMSDAITAVHSLLIRKLRDVDAAYSFSRRETARLAVNARFRQYDGWFMSEAKKRGDLQAVTDRLIALSNSGVSEEYLELFHSGDLVWLTNTLDSVRLDQRPSKVTAELVKSTEELAKANKLNEELRLLAAWQTACIRYNFDRMDGKEVQAPINTSKQLLAKYPRHAADVQTDWAGGRTGQHYRGDPKKYWPHQLEGKLPPIQEALGKMDEIGQLRLLQTWSHEYYGRDARVMSVEEARKLALNSPQIVNQIFGPELALDWPKLKPEEIKALSPKLEKNPSPEAAAIRAMAFAGDSKDFDKAMDHLVKHEGWRLSHHDINHRLPDALWHWAGKPGGNSKRDQAIKRFNAELRKDLIGDEKKVQAMPANKREQEFNRLWKDLKSKKPSITDVIGQTYLLAKCTPKAMETLLADDSLEARWLCSRLLNDRLRDGNKDFYDYRAGTLSGDRYNSYYWRMADFHGGVERLKTHKDLKHISAPHPLLPALTKAVERQVKSKKLEDWLVMSWINAQHPDALKDQEALAAQVIKSPSWKNMPAHLHDGMMKRFPNAALNANQQKLRLAASSKETCKALLALTPESSAADAIKAVKTTQDSLLKTPRRMAVTGLSKLGKLGDEVWANADFITALADMIETVRLTDVPEGHGDRDLSHRLQNVANKGDTQFILQTASHLWFHIERHHSTFNSMKELITKISSKQPEVASALARIGLQTMARHQRGHTWFKREEDIPMLKAIRGKTALQMGLVEIPVPASHPHYPVHLAQAEWMTENRDSSWKLIDTNWEVFAEIHRQMSLPFLMWVLERSIQTRDSDRQEQLIRSLLSWTSEAGSSLRPTEKAEIEIAYGDIAVQRGQLREAGQIFDKIQKKEEYKDLPIRYEAALRRVRVDRLAKNYDGALQLLTELEMERVAGLWSDIRFARAEIYFDQEEYGDCADDINSILNREPNHPDAKILLGKVQLRQQKLMEATKLEIGSSSSQQTLVPGERLQVALTDPTLAVSGAGTEIEVVVWATSGDREQFFLRQFGDQKTKYVGEVDTDLGKPKPDDGTLQVIGNDEVYYAYSERFRAKMNGLEENRGGPITISSDAVLMASARKLLSESEQRRADMQQVMEELTDDNRRKVSNLEGAAKAKLASRAIEASMNEPGGDPSVRSAQQNLTQTVKPGNPIHIRVVDPDASRTDQVDELKVSIASSSGDSISSVTLKETETHSGWFEGSVETTGAAARAMAQSSEPGRNPNMVISPKTDYPAWRPIAASNNPQYDFTVDLNDNLPLGEMTVTASDPGATLKSWALQTGMNEGSMDTVAFFPRHLGAVKKPWHPSVVVMLDTDHHHARNDRNVYDLKELQQHLNGGWATQKLTVAAADNVRGPSQAMTPSIPETVEFKRGNRHHNGHVVYRFRGYFHEPTNVTRHFKLELGPHRPTKKPHPSVGHPPQFLLAVNGRPITDPEKPNELEGKVNLRAGINRFEIWATGWDCMIGFGRDVRLLANLEDPEQLVECPDSFFDPSTFPDGSMDHRNAPASITPSEDGKSFKIKFAEGSRARRLKLKFFEHEGSVPSINRISLKQPDGKAVLPVAEDYAELGKNQILEILTGDRVYVRYRDDRFVTKTKERHERFLNVFFTDAKIEFADMEPRMNPHKQRLEPYYEELIRFKHGEPLHLAIHDADMDSTIVPDIVKVTIGNGSKQVTMTATETGDSTGVFKLRIIPVTGTPKEGEFQVPVGGTITASYIDEENNRPGVPTEITTRIEHAKFVQPTFVIGDSEVTPWQPEEAGTYWRSLTHGFESFQAVAVDSGRRLSERIQPRWQIQHRMAPASSFTQGDCRVVMGRYLYVEVHAPQYALGKYSKVNVFAQTDSGRAKGQQDGQGFDTSLPGTVQLEAVLTPVDQRYYRSDTPTLATYVEQSPWSTDPRNRTNDRFYVLVPVIPGMLPPYGVLTPEERKDMARLNSDSRSFDNFSSPDRSLIAKPGETIHIGFQYTDTQGKERWLTAKAKTTTHPCFDIMSDDFLQPVTAAYAGEYLNLRVVDLGADLTDDHDITNVLMQAKSGAKYNVVLHETGPHTGIFKQNVKLSYTKDPASLPEDLNVAVEGFPITYGDTVAARYTDRNGINTDILQVTISRGADGLISPFSKQYEDEEVAMRTQFSLAEAYLEMAKRHRLLGQTKQAEIEYSSAKLLLSKAMDQFTDPDTRAHAEYLLGTLTMEEADTATDPEIKETRYRAALSRFMTVTGTYSDSIHASRAQYRIATVYEKIGESDIAAQEYVKLAYKYPDSEYLATSMAKLGSHFLKKAAAYEAQAKPLLAKAETDKDAAFEGEVLQKLAAKEYMKTASIFGRLQERFPDNKLAGRAGIQAGQAYMRAKEWRKAIEMFKRVYEEESYDGPEERAAGIFWSAMCYQEIRQQMAAYSAYKRLTYDFPESKWAGYARAKLSEEGMLKLESQLEIERLEAGR